MDIARNKSLFVLILFIAASCKFILSPYSSDTPQRLQNEVNLRLIKAQEEASGPDFKVAFISDTHNYYDELDKAISTINNSGPYSFIIVTGDITNYGLLEEYEQTYRQLNDLNDPYLVVVGNHDLLSRGKKIFARMFGKTDFSFRYKYADFILFNNNNWESNGSIPDMQWISEALQQSAAPIKILTAHVSPQDKDRFPEEFISEWSNLVTTFNVNYFLNGHDHNSGENSFGSATRITVGAPTKGSYLELIFSAGEVTHKKINF
jgi:Icc protein